MNNWLLVRRVRFLSMGEDLAGASQVTVGASQVTVGAFALGDLASAHGDGVGVILGFNKQLDRERKEPGCLGTGFFRPIKKCSRQMKFDFAA